MLFGSPSKESHESGVHDEDQDDEGGEGIEGENLVVSFKEIKKCDTSAEMRRRRERRDEREPWEEVCWGSR